jgi:Fur family ferric uptake transcriptional regulator
MLRPEAPTVKHDTIRKNFETYLKTKKLRLTPQRAEIFERAFATHEHFTAETFLGWLKADGSRASRATLYRTLALLVEGGFLEELDVGTGESWYEHVLGHKHHDHLICIACGRIEEFTEPRIEVLQEEVARTHGFTLKSHDLRLLGTCRRCQKPS